MKLQYPKSMNPMQNLLKLLHVFWHILSNPPTLTASMFPMTTALWRAVMPRLLRKSRCAPPPARHRIISRQRGLPDDTAMVNGVSVTKEQFMSKCDYQTDGKSELNVQNYIISHSISKLKYDPVHNSHYLEHNIISYYLVNGLINVRDILKILSAKCLAL